MTRILRFNRTAAAPFAGGIAVIHVRFAGQSRDIPLASLGVDRNSNDRQIKQAVAVYLEVPTDEFSQCIVDRHANGNLTIRPEAVFG